MASNEANDARTGARTAGGSRPDWPSSLERDGHSQPHRPHHGRAPTATESQPPPHTQPHTQPHTPSPPPPHHTQHPVINETPVTRTVFVTRIPKGVTDDTLFEDFSVYGRVLATKVYVPKIAYMSGKNHFFNGGFVEFESFDVALYVVNTVREYRGIQTDVKWGHKSLVESIREQQRELSGEAGGLGGVRGAEGMEGQRELGAAPDTSTGGKDGRRVLPTYGTVYNPVDSFIQEQAWLWNQHLTQHYAVIGGMPGMPSPGMPPPPVMLPPGHPMMYAHHHQQQHEQHPVPHLQPTPLPYQLPRYQHQPHPYPHPAGLPINHE